MTQIRACLDFHMSRFPLDICWQSVAEILLFGDTLDNIFENPVQLFAFLSSSTDELGETKFAWQKRCAVASRRHFNRYSVGKSQKSKCVARHPRGMRYTTPSVSLIKLTSCLESLNMVLNAYAYDLNCFQLSDLLHTLRACANHNLAVPLAIALLAQWHEAFGEPPTCHHGGSTVTQFRRAARFALAIRKLRLWLAIESLHLSKSQVRVLNAWWGKDNTGALATSLHHLGSHHQQMRDIDVAVLFWETNSHLTADTDLGWLAVVGLRNGKGLGLRPAGLRSRRYSKARRWALKRRIAHVYRSLMKNPAYEEYGVSWALKTKYD